VYLKKVMEKMQIMKEYLKKKDLDHYLKMIEMDDIQVDN